MSEVKKLESVQRSLQIASRVTSSALADAKRNAPSLAGGKRRRKASPKRKASPAKKSGGKRRKSPKRKASPKK